MCDCKSRIEKRLLDNFKERFPEASDHTAKLQGYAFIMNGVTSELTLKGCMQLEKTAKFPIKKGGVKQKTVKVSMMFTFCPFCGVKYDAPEGTASDQWKVERLREVITEANDYMDTNHLTNIGHGSLLHEAFKDALAKTV